MHILVLLWVGPALPKLKRVRGLLWVGPALVFPVCSTSDAAALFMSFASPARFAYCDEDREADLTHTGPHVFQWWVSFAGLNTRPCEGLVGDSACGLRLSREVPEYCHQDRRAEEGIGGDEADSTKTLQVQGQSKQSILIGPFFE